MRDAGCEMPFDPSPLCCAVACRAQGLHFVSTGMRDARWGEREKGRRGDAWCGMRDARCPSTRLRSAAPWQARLKGESEQRAVDSKQ